MNKIIFLIIRKLAVSLLNALYNYIDKDDDGKISKQELTELSSYIRSVVKK